MKAQGVFLSEGVAKTVEIDVEEPSKNEVLIRTKACGICMWEINVFQGKIPGEGVMGHEGAGIVAAVGEAVKNVKVGDKVTALGGSAFAEFFKSDYRNVAKVPDDVKDFSYWISEPIACVVNGIRGSEIRIGDNVCLIGCGYMGLLLIQAMPRTNINRLVALDIQDERLKLAKKFGAESVFNPKKVDVVKEVREIFGGEADVVIEASGASGTLYLATDLLRPGGKLVIFGMHIMDEKVPTAAWHMKGLKILNTTPNFSLDFNKDFYDAVNLLKKGVINQEPLITHRFSYKEPEKAFKIASEKPPDYIKGVITF